MPFPTFSTKQGLSNTKSVSIVGAKDGSVWVATYNGLNRWKDGRISAATARKLSGSWNTQGSTIFSV